VGRHVAKIAGELKQVRVANAKHRPVVRFHEYGTGPWHENAYRAGPATSVPAENGKWIVVPRFEQAQNVVRI
jgi:hypothetical protein